MDAASRTGLLLLVFLSTLFFGSPGRAHQPPEPSPIPAPNPLQIFAQWVGQWMAKPQTISVRFAIHEVTKNDAAAVAPCGHKMCAGGKCYEVEEGVIEGTPCDAPRTGDASTNDDSITPAEEEPIIEVPAAPPLPPRYQFTQRSPVGRENPHHTAAMDSLRASQVSIPASVLVSLLVDHARNETQLAMTRELLEERTAFLDHIRELSDRNAQLQSQLAISQIYLDYHATANALETPDGSSDVRSIQEDLSNIRRQIALLKRNQPVPFAPSYVGSEGTNENAWSQPWRSSRRSHYVPVAPQGDSPAQAAQDPQKNVK